MTEPDLDLEELELFPDLPDPVGWLRPPRSAPVLAADRWPTNGDLLADCARLGYLTVDDHVLDPTFGRGRWWTRFSPGRLTAHDLDPDKSPTGTSISFTDLPYEAGTFDAAVFDPPYVSVGGRSTSTIPGFLNAYGIDDAPRTARGLQELIDEGLAEVARVVKPRGLLLVKCMDYVDSSKLWLGTHWTLVAGLELGLELVDRFEHIGEPRSQPSTNLDGSPRRQLHARRNLSTLFVFSRPAELRNRRLEISDGSEEP